MWYLNIVPPNATELQLERSNMAFQAQLWIVAIYCKILPCILLTILSGLLIHTLWSVSSIHLNCHNQFNPLVIARQSI